MRFVIIGYVLTMLWFIDLYLQAPIMDEDP